MSGQIIFFEKSKCDLQQPNVSASASQGNDFAEYALNRRNDTSWITTGSVDADLTTWTAQMVDERKVSSLIISGHNFKSFKIQKWNGAAYVDMATAIDETTNTLTTNYYEFPEIDVSSFRITVRGTMVANSDKEMAQFIATRKIGQLNGWPIIKSPTHSRNRKITKMLSGKSYIQESIGSFSCSLTAPTIRLAADLAIIEALYESNEGFLFWPCGGVTSQFSSSRKGYRLEDIFLMKCRNEYVTEFYKGWYGGGIKTNVQLEEVVT